MAEYFQNGTGGVDTIFSTVSWTMGNNLENLTLGGSANINGTGIALANVLRSNTGNNRLTGGAGADTFVLDIWCGKDTATDFARGDVMDVTALASFNRTRPAVIDLGNDTLIDFDDGSSITLLNIDPTQLIYDNGMFGIVG